MPENTTNETFWSASDLLHSEITFEELVQEVPTETTVEPDYNVHYQACEPFWFNGHFYVVMDRERLVERYGQFFAGDRFRFTTGQSYYSEANDQDYILVSEVPDSTFGAANTWRITWIEPEPDYDDDYYGDSEDSMYDSYSEERIDHDSSGDLIPWVSTRGIERKIPLISFEQEFSGNGDRVATRTYDMGYGCSRYAESYHSSDGRYNSNENRFCYVETDSSCGYELIFDRIDISDREQMSKVAEVQEMLRELKSDGDIRLSARCGFHVHVDISGWGMKEIVSAYHLWNYLEDTVFRFASCFWNVHRDEETGGDYSAPVRKGLNSRTEIGQSLTRRRDALNFSPFLNSRSNCSCGAALYEDWASCTCEIRQPTLEFRVFNATTNTRKIRAFLAFCIGFVNAVDSEDFSPEFFKEMRWISTSQHTIPEGSESWLEASKERINFIFEKFPLTSAEKSDIMYCLRNSSLEPVLESL